MTAPNCNRWWPIVVLVMGPAVACGVADGKEPDGSPAAAVLRLADGDFIEGTLLESDRRDLLRWQGAQFAAPLDFDLKAISSAHFPRPRERVKPLGDYCFELQGGDLLFGSFVGLKGNEIDVDSPRFGRLHIQRTRIERVSRWRDGKELVYMGPSGLSGWGSSKPADAWRAEANCLVTDKEDAQITGEMRLPPQACVEMELAWMDRADFAVALGAQGQDDSHAFRLEMIEDKLVCLWATDDDADLAVLQQSQAGAGRCHLVIYLDQNRRRAVVFASDGALLADLSVSAAKSKPETGIHLLSRRGGLRLEQLIIRRCSGEPQQAAGSRSHLYRTDGSIVYGEVEELDAKKNQFLVAEKDSGTGRKTPIDAALVDSIVWRQANHAPSGEIHVCLHDGVRISGKLREVKGGRLWLDSPGVAEPLGVNLADMQALSMRNHSRPIPDDKHRQGRLEMDGVRLRGYVVDGAELSKRGCLGWHPCGAATASPLQPNASGTIVYCEPLTVKTASPRDSRSARRAALAPVPRAANWMDVLAAGVPKQSGPACVSHGPANLYLRTGDKIPCKVKRIDERGVWFESSEYEATFVPHKRIKAVELENTSRDTKVNPTKRDRLLTLPRMRRDNPPKHLIRSVDGDYLRANVISLDEKTLTVEVRLEERHLPRGNIARIIWLHEGDKERETTPATQMRVQSLGHDGNRVTVLFEKLTDATLIGTSDTMGQCRIKLKDVDELFFGKMSELTASDLPYQRWKLRAAQEPKFAESGKSEGTESALVAKMAPDFTLEKLDGTPFRLHEQRGKVVVLEFWATWCGACVQVLPKIDHLVNHMNNKDVVFVAVNLQENPKAIQATLERLKVRPTVVLDQNGAVAAKYAAAAIPQTVIIDRSGRVSRVFVGGGPQYIEQVQESLQKILNDGNGRAASN